jgi:chromosome segregation ATPase
VGRTARRWRGEGNGARRGRGRGREGEGAERRAMAAPSDREKRLAAQVKLVAEHVDATDAKCAEQERELASLRLRSDGLTRELAEARGESRSQRHEIKAMSRCLKGLLDERSLERGADARPAQLPTAARPAARLAGGARRTGQHAAGARRHGPRG